MFDFTEEQLILRDSLASYLRDNYSFQARREVLSTPEGWSLTFWRNLERDLGIFGAALPEALGGLGGSSVELMIIMEEFGRALVTEPMMETLVIGSGLVKRCGADLGRRLTAGLLAGDIRLALAFAEPKARYAWSDVALRASKRPEGYLLNGHKAVVIGAAAATHFVVSARTSGAQRDEPGVSLMFVPADARGISRRDYRTVDGRIASELYFEDVALSSDALLGTEGQGHPLLSDLIDLATVAVCAEASGVLRRLLDDTVEYTKQRHQFGKPLASFQALQHRMVDMHIHVEQAISMATMATMALETEDAVERARRVSAAKAYVGKACRFVGQNAIQLHGGIGVTDELAVAHYFKRATMIESQFGSTDHHLARYERLSFAEAG